MRRTLLQWLNPIEDMPCWQFYLRLVWIVIQLFLAYVMAAKASLFFYQAF